MEKNWYKSKTVWGAILGILGLIGAVLRGEMPIEQAIPAILAFWTALGFRFALK